MLKNSSVAKQTDMYTMATNILQTGIESRRVYMSGCDSAVFKLPVRPTSFIDSFYRNVGDRQTTDLWGITSVDTTNTTAIWCGGCYVKTMTIFDNFNDASVNTDKWTVYHVEGGTNETAGSVGEDTDIDLFSGVQNDNTSRGQCDTYIESKIGMTRFCKFTLTDVNFTADSGGTSHDWKIYITIGGEAVLTSASGGVSAEVAEDTYEFVKIGETVDYKLIAISKGNKLLKEVKLAANNDGLIKIRGYVDFTSVGGAANAQRFIYISVDNFYLDNFTTTDNYVYTKALVIPTANIKSLYVSAFDAQPTNTDILFDVSINSGVAWCKTSQDFNQEIDTSLYTGSCLNLKFTLSATGSADSPVLNDYGVMVWY
jgi:hypothetical protein